MENVLINAWNDIIHTKYEAYYQPLFNYRTGELTGFESLARLNDPDRTVSPANFISTLENNGMIVSLDFFIFESACKLIKNIIDNKLKPVPVSVNLSRYDFYEADFIEKLEKIRKKYDVDVKWLYIEITKDLAVDDKNQAVAIVNKFRHYGYKVALDKFDGYDPELSFLNEINYNFIKLDIVKINKRNNIDKIELISSILKTGKKNNISIIVQGVETQEEVDFFKEKECEVVQGYYYAKPMPGKSAHSLLVRAEEKKYSLLPEYMRYKDKFEFVLEQLNVHYWEYNVELKEIYPCYRSSKDFGLSKIINNCPNTIIESGIIAKDYVDDFCDLFKQVDDGVEFIETETKINQNKYQVIGKTQYDNNGKAIIGRFILIDKSEKV